MHKKLNQVVQRKDEAAPVGAQRTPISFFLYFFRFSYFTLVLVKTLGRFSLIKGEKMKKLFLLLTLMTLTSTMAQNKNDIYLGDPGYGGNGCPQGSASAILSPDQKSLSILFDEYYVEAGGGKNSKKLARKSCNVAIPVHVPQGFSVSIVDVDYRGYLSLPRGARATFSAEYFFAGRRGPKLRESFRGEMDDEYMIEDKLGLAALVWSNCGADVNLRVNTSLMVRTNRQKQEALGTVDSADFSAGLVYHLKWKRCRQ